ncbi:MarR family transcriptional regulator [Pikeienuella piscinae]|uniref:MarR family transcriptional regulator n=1 Tax=Pikeienuella piscinae TaxID=2748098 RepID=A0A7L5BYD8_9RHOB|nr:MarR family transcriptional regulator [Pikeienuella piscinae]QIE55858.1 MarR family transcriptional regulator [Pikeienuella piscinae]
MRAIDDPITFTVLTEIRAIEQLVELRLQRALPDGLELSQFAVLNHFSHLGGEKSPAQLAKVFQLTKGAMTNTIQRLEAAGHVRVRPDEKDRRRKLVSLTESGLEMRNRAINALAPVFAEITAGVGRDRLRSALPALRELRLFLSAAEHTKPRKSG